MNPILKDLIKNMKTLNNEEIFFYDISKVKKDYNLRYLSLNALKNILNRKNEFQGDFLTLQDLLIMLDDLCESQSNSLNLCEQRIRLTYNKVIDIVVEKIKAEEKNTLEFVKEINSSKINNFQSDYEYELLNLADDKINFQKKFSELLENVENMKNEIQEFFRFVDKVEIDNEQFIKNFIFNSKNLLNSFILQNPLNDKTVEIKNNGLIVSKNKRQHSCIISNIPFKKDVELTLKVNKMEANTLMFFGVIQKINNLNAESFSNKTSYGWAINSNQIYIDGIKERYFLKYDKNIFEGDKLILMLKSQQGKLYLKNLTSNVDNCLDIPKKLDYYFHFNLYGYNDELEIISINYIN